MVAHGDPFIRLDHEAAVKSDEDKDEGGESPLSLFLMCTSPVLFLYSIVIATIQPIQKAQSSS